MVSDIASPAAQNGAPDSTPADGCFRLHPLPGATERHAVLIQAPARILARWVAATTGSIDSEGPESVRQVLARDWPDREIREDLTSRAARMLPIALSGRDDWVAGDRFIRARDRGTVLDGASRLASAARTDQEVWAIVFLGLSQAEELEIRQELLGETRDRAAVSASNNRDERGPLPLIQYREADADSFREWISDDDSTPDIVDIVHHVVALEGPIHPMELRRRAAKIAKQLGMRANRRLMDVVEGTLGAGVRTGKIGETRGFYTLPPDQRPQARNRSRARSKGLRDPRMLPPTEIREALRLFLGIDRPVRFTVSEACQGVVAMLGLSDSADLRRALEDEVRRMLRDDVLVIRETSIALK